MASVYAQLRESWRDGPGEEDLRARLDRLTRALASDVDEELPPFQHQTVSELAADQQLLELLYRETLAGWFRRIPAPPSEEMLHLLQAFERLRAATSPRQNSDSPIRWSIPEGTDLVVELAHDLRSPLTSIIFLTETLRGAQAGPVNDLQRRQLGIIYSAALSLVSMASDVIELARGGLQLLDRRPSPVSIAELLESTHDILKPIVDEKGLSIRTQGTEVDRRLGYPVALSRILLNLASNAVKFTERGEIEVTARAVGSSGVEFSVRDTGPGIDPEAERQLFEPLRHNPTSNRFGFSGSGLGLAICRRLVAAMGGELQYATSPGRGTRFYFVIDLPPLDLP